MRRFCLFLLMASRSSCFLFIKNARNRFGLKFSLDFSSSMTKTKDGVYIVSQMPEPLPQPLRNNYYLLRHGQSWGNVEGVISSCRSLATSDRHGLTPLGYEQASESAKSLLNLIMNEKKNGGGIYFYSSPFARARQTAQTCLRGFKDAIVGKELKLEIHDEIVIHDGLMERFFGRLDNQAIHTYAFVWPVDMFNVTHSAFDVESVAAVATRLRETILSIDNNPTHKTGDVVVLTSHADVLQILQLYAAGAENTGVFSSYRFANGEVRKMGRSIDTLPSPQPLTPPKIGT